MTDLVELCESVNEWMVATTFRRIVSLIGIITIAPVMIYMVIGALLFFTAMAIDFIRGGEHWEGKWVPYSFKEKNG